MPAILDALQVDDAYWYHQTTTFLFQFMFYLMGNVLAEVDKLKQKIQYDLVEFSPSRLTLVSSISILKSHFLCGQRPNHGRLTKDLGPFSSQAWVDGVLRWGANDVEGTYHPMHHGQIFDWEDTLEECKMIGAIYVQAIMDSLNKRLFNSLVFNTINFFNP